MESRNPPPSSSASAGRTRRIFGELTPPLSSHARSPSRSPILHHSGSSQSLDPLSLSGTEDEGPQQTLTCPICQENMITLLQLNRHLDDVHREVEEGQKETVKSWFKKRMIKAKSLPPVVALNKLGKSEPFERNGDTQGSYGLDATIATDDIVTKKHWQPETGNDYCSEPSCGKPLNNKNGRINCRKCGKLFCDVHTMYQMKLSMSAQWEPVRGTWCRVCETCYKTREGYADTEGATTDHTASFLQIRQKNVDRTYLEVNRLEKRLTKLLTLMSNPPKSEPATSGFLKSFTGGQNQLRLVEQSVVTWQEDEGVTQCPFCNLPFNFANRKHHCRLCGRVVCSNPATNCSTNVGLNVSGSISSRILFNKAQSEKHPSSEMSVDVRMCQDCKSILFSKRDFARESTKTPRYVTTYQNMILLRQGIEQLLPKFKTQVFLLKQTQIPSKEELDEAHKVRSRLVELFTQYDAQSKRILQFPAPSDTDKRVQSAINASAIQFLQTNLLPLQSIPRVLKPKQKSPLSVSNGISPAKEKELKEKMMVLEEQKYLVENMIQQAQKGRRMEEVSALKENVNDLTIEIDKIKTELGDLFIE